MIIRALKFEALGRSVDFDIELDPTNTNDAYILYYLEHGQCYEAELAWVMLRVLREGDTAIDVGANIGFFTLFMARLVGQTGLVIAGEPAHNNLPSLRKNLRLNGINNAQIIERPFWCCEDDVTFYINSDSRGSNALFDPANWPGNVRSQANPMPIKMRSIALDALDIDKTKVRMIKIDTEGAEQKVLEGARGLLKDFHPPYILAELNPHGLAQSGCDNETLRAFMREMGYDTFFLHHDDALPAFVPNEVKIVHQDDIVISNVMFSTMRDVIAAWPEMTA